MVACLAKARVRTRKHRAFPGWLSLLIWALAFCKCSDTKSPYSPPVDPPETLDVTYAGSALWSGLWDLEVAGDHAYLAFDYGLGIFDVSNVSAPTLVSSVYLPCEALFVAADAGHAYVGSLDHLSIVDATVPANAHVVAELDSPMDGGLVVHGGYAYLASGAGLTVLDVSNPAAPVTVTTLDEGCYSPAVDGGYLYTTGYPGLYVFDISTPALPEEVATLEIDKAQNLAVKDGIAAVWSSYCTQDLGPCWGLTTFVDIRNPTSPSVIGTYPPHGVGPFESSMSLGFVGRHLIQSSGAVLVIEIPGDTDARLVGSFDSGMDAERSCLAVSGDTLYIPALRVLSVSNPEAPAMIGEYALSGCGRVRVRDHTAFAATARGLTILDIADPAGFREQGTLKTAWGVTDLAIDGDHAYLADIGLTIADISDPGAPIQVGSLATPLGARAVAVGGDYAYLAVGTAGLLIADISNPRAPRLAKTIDGLGEVTDVALSDTLACVIGYGGRLSVLDISDPPNAIIIGRLVLGSEGWAVAIQEPYAYVANGISGMRVVDLTDPAEPTLVSTLATEYWAMDIEVAGDFAFIAKSAFRCSYGGLFIADISDRKAPLRAGHFDTPGWPRGVAVSGDHILLADILGLTALEVKPK